MIGSSEFFPYTYKWRERGGEVGLLRSDSFRSFPFEILFLNRDNVCGATDPTRGDYAEWIL